MKKVFKQIEKVANTIRIFDYDNNTFTMYHIAKNVGFPFGIPQHETITNMGYVSLDDAIKKLTQRGYISNEQLIDYEKQRESERLGYIKLGSYRLHTNRKIDDVIEKLSNYGMGYCDAQNQIYDEYTNGEVLSFKPQYLQTQRSQEVASC